jgi:hypothetical protein
MGAVDEADEKLAASCVFAGVGHGDGAPLVFMDIFVALAPYRPPGASPPAALGASPLGHEAFDDPVKFEPVIKAAVGEMGEVGHGVWDLLGKELDPDIPFILDLDVGPFILLDIFKIVLFELLTVDVAHFHLHSFFG